MTRATLYYTRKIVKLKCEQQVRGACKEIEGGWEWGGGRV